MYWLPQLRRGTKQLQAQLDSRGSFFPSPGVDIILKLHHIQGPQGRGGAFPELQRHWGSLRLVGLRAHAHLWTSQSGHGKAMLRSAGSRGRVSLTPLGLRGLQVLSKKGAGWAEGGKASYQDPLQCSKLSRQAEYGGSAPFCS